MIESFTGRLVGWTRNTSCSRTFSRMRTKMFSFANSKTSASPMSVLRYRQYALSQGAIGVAGVDAELVGVHGDVSCGAAGQAPPILADPRRQSLRGVRLGSRIGPSWRRFQVTVVVLRS